MNWPCTSHSWQPDTDDPGRCDGMDISTGGAIENSYFCKHTYWQHKWNPHTKAISNFSRWWGIAQGIALTIAIYWVGHNLLGLL